MSVVFKAAVGNTVVHVIPGQPRHQVELWLQKVDRRLNPYFNDVLAPILLELPSVTQPWLSQPLRSSVESDARQCRFEGWWAGEERYEIVISRKAKAFKACTLKPLPVDP